MSLLRRSELPKEALVVLDSLTMENSSPLFDDEAAMNYVDANRDLFRAEAHDLFDRHMGAKNLGFGG